MNRAFDRWLGGVRHARAVCCTANFVCHQLRSRNAVRSQFPHRVRDAARPINQGMHPESPPGWQHSYPWSFLLGPAPCGTEQSTAASLLVTGRTDLTGDLGFEPRLTAPEAVVLPLHQSPSGSRVRISPNLPYPTDFWPHFQDGGRRPKQAASEPITATICTSHRRPAMGFTRAVDDSVGRALLPDVKVCLSNRRDVRSGQQREGPNGASD
jgi:hypothetical protein